jgi:hypothetical protein
MSKQEPTVWQQCKAISEALAPSRESLLVQLAAGSEKGEKLAAPAAPEDLDLEPDPHETVRRLRAVLRTLTADQVAPEWPDELLDSPQRNAQRRV